MRYLEVSSAFSVPPLSEMLSVRPAKTAPQLRITWQSLSASRGPFFFSESGDQMFFIMPGWMASSFVASSAQTFLCVFRPSSLITYFDNVTLMTVEL